MKHLFVVAAMVAVYGIAHAETVEEAIAAARKADQQSEKQDEHQVERQLEQQLEQQATQHAEHEAARGAHEAAQQESSRHESAHHENGHEEGAGETEYFFQPAKGKTAIEIAIGYTPGHSFTISDIASGTKTEDETDSAMDYSVKAYHGFSKDWAAGLFLAYGSDKEDHTPVTGPAFSQKSSGLKDVGLWTQYSLDLPSVQLYFGGLLGINIGKKTLPTPTADGNQSTGGISLTPQVGAAFPIAHGLKLGLAWNYRFNADRTSNDQGNPAVDWTVKGGNIFGLDGFIEKEFGKIQTDLYIRYRSIASEDDINGNIVSTTAAHTTLTVGLLGAFPVAEETLIIANVSAQSAPGYSDSLQSYGSTTATTIELAARFEF